MAALSAENYNRACLMTFGELAERLAWWAKATLNDHPRTKADGDLGPFWPDDDGETPVDFANRMANGLLILQREDVS